MEIEEPDAKGKWPGTTPKKQIFQLSGSVLKIYPGCGKKVVKA